MNIDLKKVSANELVQELQSIEKVELNPHGNNSFGFDLYFISSPRHVPRISIIELIVHWADAHRHAVSVSYDTVMEAIVVRLRRIYTEDSYTPEDYIK